MLSRRKLVGTSILAAFVLLWIGYHVNWIRERRAVLNAPEKYNVFQVCGRVEFASGGSWEGPLTKQAPWPLIWMEKMGQESLGVNASNSAAEIANVRMLFPEAEIR